jgi:hypothetical protein
MKFKVGDKIKYIYKEGYLDEVLEVKEKTYILKSLQNPDNENVGEIFESDTGIESQNIIITPLHELL